MFSIAPQGWAFIGVIAALTLFFAVVGKSAQRPVYFSVVVDNRNRVSLSKLQAASWTILIFAALSVTLWLRLDKYPYDGIAFDIDIPGGLLAAMGISATSLAATPALLSLKGPFGVAGSSATGVATKAAPTDAKWADIFTGDDMANAGVPDLSKIQQFLITTLLLIYYAITVGNWLVGPHVVAQGTIELPDFDKQLAWLLGISHAGYLAYKAAPHTAN